MRPYLELLKHVLDHGVTRADRTGTGTRSVFGHQSRYDLAQGFPLVTTKRCHMKSIVYELLWFIRGDTNVKYLKENGVRIWDEWADEQGELGPIYGAQWRRWRTHSGEEVDQLASLIEGLKNTPHSRRHILSAWNVGALSEMALPPCHALVQFYVAEGKLSCQLYQRSADLFLGVPFNIASYALLTHMIAQVCQLAVGELIHTVGDAHIYQDHQEQVTLQLTRSPLPLPQIKLNPEVRDIDHFGYDDIELIDYVSHPHIKGEVSV